LANCLAIHQLEEHLHPVQTVQTTEPTIQPVRTTRGVNNSAKYNDLLPRKLREERAQDKASEAVAKPIEMEVNSVIFITNTSLL
jgi:hypothetical protein